MSRLIMFLLFSYFVIFAESVYSSDITRTHGISLTGSLKYSEDFQHFDYTDKNAKKGGTLRRAIIGTYDTFNTFALKGIPFRSSGSIYDTLLKSSLDESVSYYGLLAESLEYPDDYSWVQFNLNKKARWNDSVPLTSDDVLFTFNTLVKNSPFHRNYYKAVVDVKIIDKHTIKFIFNKSGLNKELPLILGQMVVLPKHYWKSKDISKSTLEPPLGSGPYKIKSFVAGKNVVLVAADDYWGKDLPVNIGQNNFETIAFEYFRDQTVAFEAFKAGHFDFISEGSGKRWYHGYKGRYFDMGLIKKEEISHKNPTGMMGIILNTSVKPFDNILVREALTYAYDYEWINKNIYYGNDIRHTSYFSNSELAVENIPSKEVVEIIKRVKPDVSDKVLYKKFELPKTDATGNNRSNLMKSVTLFEEGGYTIKNGKMVDSSDKPLQLEIVLISKALEKDILSFKKSLERIGIELHIRYIDSTQYVEKVRNKDYMMIYTRIKQSDSPGNEQRNMWSSDVASEKGSRNYAKIKDTAIDQLIDLIVEESSRAKLENYVKALDRLLLTGYYTIPAGYSDRYRIAYFDKFSKPSNPPAYGLGFNTWWIDSDKEKEIDGIISR